MKLVIFGNTKYAKMIAHYFSTDTEYEVSAFTVHEKFISERQIDDIPVVKFEDIKESHPPEEYAIFIALGYTNMRFRKEIFELTKSWSYNHANYISTLASVDESIEFGENNLILHGAVIEPFVKLKDNICINSGSIICHHTEIDSHSFIAAGCVIGGNVTIGENCFIGFNSTVLQRSKLQTETLLSASSLLMKDTESHTRYQGIPAIKYETHKKLGIKI